MQRQIFFDSETVVLYYLSPYTKVYKLNDNKILLRRDDIESQITVCCSSKQALEKIIISLINGVQESQLIDLIGSKDLFEILKTSGVIE